MTNDQKIKIMKKRKILLSLIIVFGVLTLVLALLSLTERSNPLFLILAIISFLIETILSNCRNKLNSKEVKSDSKNQE